MISKRVLISCGTIPARLDSVKFLGNRFKGGLAFKTAEYLHDNGFEVTIVKWKFTEYENNKSIKRVNILDVFEYYDYIKNNVYEYDAFVLAGAVANLTPSNPLEGKFPSHNYKVGEKFNIEFEIAPRIIDLIKELNPHACLIGYKLYDAADEDLIEIGRHTLHDSKANVIFANHPAKAKYEKIALLQDNTVLKMNFEEHLKFMVRVINAAYYKTTILNDTTDYPERVLIERFEQEGRKFGCIAFKLEDNRFITTSRGHNGSYSVVHSVDFENKIIESSKNKATLNAPTLKKLFELTGCDYIVHEHFYKESIPSINYVLPGTHEEVTAVEELIKSNNDIFEFNVLGHGYYSCKKFGEIIWDNYYEQFPERYFRTPFEIKEIIDSTPFKESKTLEIGGNKNVCSKYSYDPYVKSDNALNLSAAELKEHTFDYIVIRNAISYISVSDLNFYKSLLNKGGLLIANTFKTAPELRVRDEEVVYVKDDYVNHYLYVGDEIFKHRFYNRSLEFWLNMGFEVKEYNSNSIILKYTK